LVAKGSVWYVVARVGADIRSYRVSRIREASIIDQTFDRPSDFDLASYWKSSAEKFRERLPRYEVIVRVNRPIDGLMQSMIRFGDRDVNRADRLRFGSAARPRDTGHADSVCRAESLPHALRQCDGNLLRHFAVLLDDRRIDTGEIDFRFRRVANSPSHEV